MGEEIAKINASDICALTFQMFSRFSESFSGQNDRLTETV